MRFSHFVAGVESKSELLQRKKNTRQAEEKNNKTESSTGTPE